MGLAWGIACRSLRQRPGRTLFSVLGIAVGIATVVGIFTLDHSTLVGRSVSDEPEWRAEIEVSPSARVVDPRSQLERVPGVGEVAAAFQSEALLALPGTEGDQERVRRVHLVAVEAEGAGDLGALRIAEGRALTPGGTRREVLVGEALARDLGLEPGTELSLARPRRAPARDCIEGEWRARGERSAEPPSFETFAVVGVLEREGIGRRSRGEVVVVDYGFGRELYRGSHVQTRYWVRRDPGVNLERLQANLGQAWSYDLKRSVIIGQAADERAFRNGVRFAGLLALVLGLYVIFHTLSMSLLERVREVGVLHALGATRAQIGRAFLTEAAVVAGLGGLAGLAGGLALARLLLRAGITTIGVGRPIRVFAVPWEVVAPLAAGGVAIALAGSIYPLVKAHRADAVGSLRGEELPGARRVAVGFRAFAAVLLALILPLVYFQVVPVIGEAQAELVGVLMLGLAILALFVAIPLVVPSLISHLCVLLARPFERLWPLSGKLSARAMRQGPVRVAGAVAGIALVAAGFVGLRGMTRSLEAEIEAWGSEAFLDKVYVRNLPRAPFEELAEHLKTYPGVIGVEPNEARTYVPFLLVGVKESELAAWGPVRERPELARAMREERGVILSRRLARHRDYEVGDTVHVETPGGGVTGFPVVEISDAYGYFPHPDERLYGVVSERWMRELFCIDTDLVSTISVRLGPGADPDVVATAVRERFPNAPLSIETGEHLYSWHTSDIARDFVLFDIILLLTVALAGLGVLNGQLLAGLERAKELGILKALGASRRQIAGMVFLESAVVGVLGGALGVALGSAMTPFIVRALAVISGLPLPPRSAGPWLLWAWAGSAALALGAGLYPIWRMNRADAIAAVRGG